jgi:DNA-3-methyladenine glycosylase
VVCADVGESSAVLLRAAAPVTGLEAMYAARGPAARRDRDLCSGPGKLGQAFGLERSSDGADLVAGDLGLQVTDDGVPPPVDPVVTTRVGISVAVDDPWRWYVPNNPHVSRK